MKTLYEDFVKLQAELPSVMKDATGQVGNQKFKYADLHVIVETIRPILFKHGFAFMQSLQTLNDATFVVTTLVHKSGESIASQTRIDYPGDNIKVFGAAVTYYRRYALQSLLGIVADADADDNKETIGKKEAPKPQQTEADKLKLFCDLWKDKYASVVVVAQLKSKATTHNTTVSACIDRYTGKPELFEEHMQEFILNTNNN